jgi:tripartite-type tricarboxylate transporter receptor subunit TctC
MNIRKTIAVGAGLCAAVISAAPAFSADLPAAWPSRPVRLLVPFAPGGGTDIVARIIAPPLSEILGQQFVVDNRSGASGNIAIEIAARSAPDGYTVLVNNVSTGSINPTAFASSYKFDPTKELLPVIMIASIPNLMVCGANFPANSMKELVEYVRARPGQLNYSNPIGAYSHLDMLEFLAKNGLKMENVPSKGAGSSIASVISGEIHCSGLNAATVIPQVKAGRMKALVTTAKARLPELPDVPTMAEAGFPGMGSVNWNGFFVPAKTPTAIVDRLNAAVLQALARPNIAEAYNKAGIPLTPTRTPAEFQAFVDSEVKRWARILKENNINLQP